ncbi:MAG: LacI family DNA-binding transcriptional regulator [Proteobacteria bacterium]|nr:LacI family DNA-binding transcriptional regulator [Pseudomonadota bacterium]
MKEAQRTSVTIREVADLADVSSKTVSRVLNNEPTVHADTRNRILRAMEQLDYRPNLNARGLAGDRSFLIGLFCEKPGDYLSEFQAGAVQRCRESDYHLMVEPWEGASADVGRQVNTLLRQLRLEGVILLPPLSDHPVILGRLADAAIPTVRIAPKREPADSPSVGIDDRAAARRLTAHLLDLGHRAIGFIRGPAEHGATEQRYIGFSEEMRSRGVPVKPNWVQTGNFAFEGGLLCAERMLRGSTRPTAIFASNDDMAAAVICVARQLGLSLPAQLSVVGFDDAPVATMVWPQLTTIRQPVRAMARVATDLIIEHSPRRNGWPQPIPRQRLKFELILRNSTAPPQAVS